MDGYYIDFNYINDNNNSASRAKIEWGIFLNKEEAQKQADELNLPIKANWENDIKREKERMEKIQKKWDVLNAAGIAEGVRPVLSEWYQNQTEWKPNADDGYFSIAPTIIR